LGGEKKNTFFYHRPRTEAHKHGGVPDWQRDFCRRKNSGAQGPNPFKTSRQNKQGKKSKRRGRNMQREDVLAAALCVGNYGGVERGGGN